MAIFNPTEDQLNEWLSQQTMRGTIGGNRLADLVSQELPMNSFRNNATGQSVSLPSIQEQGGMSLNDLLSQTGANIQDKVILQDKGVGYRTPTGNVVGLDSAGRPWKLEGNPRPPTLKEAMAQAQYEGMLLENQTKQAQLRGVVKPQLVDGQWVFPPSQDAPTGRAVPVEGFNKLGKALPNPAVKDLSAAGAAVEDSARLKNSFNTEYGGKTILGDMSNTLKRVFGDDTGQAQWWQDMDALQNQTRHNLFGSALTKTELQAWEKTSITPRMNPDQIVQNLARRQEIESRAASKLARAYTSAGYNKDQINELLGTAAEYVNQPAPPVKGQYKNENAPVPVRSEAEAMKLPKGTVFIMNGRRGVNR